MKFQINLLNPRSPQGVEITKNFTVMGSDLSKRKTSLPAMTMTQFKLKKTDKKVEDNFSALKQILNSTSRNTLKNFKSMTIDQTNRNSVESFTIVQK